MVWMGPVKIPLCAGAQAANVPPLQVRNDVVENVTGFQPALPLLFGAKQVFFRHHFENRTDILRHAAVDQHQALLKLLARFRRHLLGAENLVVGQQPAAADAEFRVALPGRDPVNQLDSRPHPAGILPAASRAPQPFTQNGARGHQAAVVFAKAAGERADLVGGAHAQGNEAGQKVGGYRQARAAGNIVHLADDFDAVARAGPSNGSGRRREAGWRPSIPGGTMPEAITAALSRPR